MFGGFLSQDIFHDRRRSFPGKMQTRHGWKINPKAVEERAPGFEQPEFFYVRTRFCRVRSKKAPSVDALGKTGQR
jgi:hypothetical protein